MDTIAGVEIVLTSIDESVENDFPGLQPKIMKSKLFSVEWRR